MGAAGPCNPNTATSVTRPAVAVAVAVAERFHEPGATVTVSAPKALDNARKLHPALDYIKDPIAAVQDHPGSGGGLPFPWGARNRASSAARRRPQVPSPAPDAPAHRRRLTSACMVGGGVSKP